MSNWDTSNISDFSYAFYNGNATGAKVDFDMSNGWNVENMTQAIDIIAGYKTNSLSTANYDSTLISWASQNVNSNVSINFGNAQYSYEAAAARQTLIDTYGWTITDGGQAVVPEFVIQVKTDNAGTSADNEFTLPWIGIYDVDWGDGNTDTGVTDAQTHTYSTSGTYDVAVTATTGRIYFNNGGDKAKLLDIKNWGTCAWTSMEKAFYSCRGLSNISAIDVINLTNCTSLSAMFRNSSVSQIYTSNWDVSNITSLYQTFTFCSNIQSLDVSSWDVSSVISMESLFRGMTALTTLDVSSWDVSNLSGIGASRFIFQDSPNINPDISNWVLGNNSLEKMLEDADSFDRSLANWDISSTPNLLNFMQNASGMSTANYDATLISWASQNPTSTNANFGGSQYTYEAAAARQTLIDTYGWTITDGGQAVSPEFALKWETTTPNEEIQIGVGDGTFDYVIDWGDGTVESYTTNDNISHTYATAGDHITKITGDFPHMNMQNITDDVYREKLRDVLNWGTIVWQDWTSMFRNCAGFTALTATDLPNLSNVTSFVHLASGGRFGYHYNSSVQNWDVSNVTSMHSFSHYGDWRNKISTWDTSNVTDFTNFLRSCGNFDNGGDLADMDNFDVSSAINMNWMFNRTTQMANVYIGSWDVSNVTSMNTIFNPLAMTNSGIENWDISNVWMFNQFNAYGQTDISLANWTPISMATAGGFWFSNNAMSVANYDATLISWAGQTLQNNVTFDFGSSQYTMGGAAEAARNTLINTYGWTITDGGGLFVGLLDTYPNASAAYSLRDLASASVGSAVVRVRRSSDNTEQDFTSAEITNGTLTTFTGANDGFVTTWYDQSGNGNNSAQATATTQPKLVSSGVVILDNGLPAIDYDASGLDYLSLASRISDVGSVFQVWNAEADTGANTQFILGDSSNYNYHAGTAENNILSGNASPSVYNGANYINSISYNFRNVYRPIEQCLISMIHLSSTNKVNQLTRDRGGNSRSWKGKMQEIILYSTDETSNLQGINENLNDHYNIYEHRGNIVGGLLFDYPTSNGAYSLRNLAEYDNGFWPVIRIRRSNDNVEQDIFATDITDGTLESFIGVGNDGFVTKWYNQIPALYGEQPNDASQTTAIKQPKLVSNGVVITDNGKPALFYDSTGTIGLTLLYDFDNINSVFQVLRTTSTTGREKSLILGTIYNGTPYNYLSGNEGQWLSNSAGTVIKNGSNYLNDDLIDMVATVRTTNQYLLSMIHTSAVAKVGSFSYDRNAPADRSWQGYMQEIILYPTDQTTNRDTIKTNINTEYDIYEPVNSGLLADYPGASAAYSLRNLVNATTNVVRVRRSNDNTEQDFTATDITDGTLATFCSGTDGFVAIWYDQSGSSNNAVQPAALGQPKIVENGLVLLSNNKPSLRFKEGSTKRYLNQPLYDELNSSFSVLSVVQADGNGSQYEGLLATNTMMKLARVNNGNWGTYPSGVTSTNLYTSTINLVTMISSDGNTGDFYTNNTSDGSFTSTDGQDRKSIGGINNQEFNGFISEMIIYPSDQSTNRTGIETNINTEYTIYPVYTDNLVASYSFDTDFSDYTGNNNLTAFGNATAGVAGGKVSDCAELDGDSDYTIASDSDDFSFTNGTNDLPFSISFWANFGSGGTCWILSKRDISTNAEYQVVFANGSLFGMNIFSQGGNQVYIAATTPFSPSTGGTTWQHFAVTYDGSETFIGVKMYIDGVSQTLTNTSSGTYLGMQNGSQPINIGSAGWSPTSNEFDGKLDEFHIWKNRELTAAEVLDIYNTENAGNSILP